MEENRKENRIRNLVRTLFCTACALLCLIPLVGMLWVENAATGETDLAQFPAIVSEDGGANIDYLSELGDWFEDHFAYRSLMISVNASLRAHLLGVSAADEVVVGSDGWLYYYGTMGEYCGWTLLSARGIDNIVYNLQMMQRYVEYCGAEFIVAIAPCKNSLYDENMPYYYTKSEERNLTALEEAMADSGVSYCSLYDLFTAQEEVLYYRKDQHWNTKGALLAVSSILSAVGYEAAAADLLEITPVETEDFIGDLNTMLYPATAQPETDYSYDAGLSWDYAAGESVEDAQITTRSDGSGILLMYRDSFANNMIPFLADTFETAYFTKMTPYDLTDAAQSGADVVIIEKAERSLSELGTQAVIMPAEIASIEVDTGDIVPEDADADADDSGGADGSDADADDSGGADGSDADTDEGVGADDSEDNADAGNDDADDATDDTDGEEVLLCALGGALNVVTDGDYIVVKGDLPEAYRTEEVQMYVGLEWEDGSVTWYLPLHLSTDESDYGYAVHFYADTYASAVNVYLACTDTDGIVCLGGAGK